MLERCERCERHGYDTRRCFCYACGWRPRTFDWVTVAVVVSVATSIALFYLLTRETP